MGRQVILIDLRVVKRNPACAPLDSVASVAHLVAIRSAHLSKSTVMSRKKNQPKRASGAKKASGAKNASGRNRAPDTMAPPAGFNPRMAERALQQVTRQIEARGLQTQEEIEAFLTELMAGGPLALDLLGSTELTPLEEAQELVYEAYNSTGAERLRLLVRALATSWDCADAY
jgi:hypothetical protein